MARYPAEANMCAFVAQWPEEVHDMANKRVLSVFALYRLQAGHWVRVDHHIVVNWAHVLVIVQCQGDGCSLSSKDGAVVWKSFGQVAAGCPDIGKTFGPLPHGKSKFCWSSKTFTWPNIILSTKSPDRGPPYKNFLPDRRTGTIRVFIGPPLFSPV